MARRGGRVQVRKQDFKRKVHRLGVHRSSLGRHAKRIFSSGPLPSRTYRCEEHGASDHELASLRRSLRRFLSPTAGGRSLTAALLFAADPTRYCAVARIARWSKEVWGSLTGAFGCGRNMAEL
eukprot:8783210-Pyramimonas_sp.AAC.1